MHLLTDQLFFPPINSANPDGVLAVGGDLLPERLILAYKSGIFPWYSAVTGGVVVGNLTGGKPIDGIVLVVVIIGIDGILFGGIGGVKKYAKHD